MPHVSIIVPCLNEKNTICLLLDAIYFQTYSRDEIEVIIADGMSIDGTREIIKKWVREHLELTVRVIDNIKQTIPSGINRAIEVAQGEFVIRLDAHSLPDQDYVQLCVTALQEGKGDNVGGKWRIKSGGDSNIARSIAAAASHPLGVGGAQYRVGGPPQAVDTVPFGAFRRDLLNRIGSFDESLLSNEDYEYNSRIRKKGGIIWFDPRIQSTYFARSTFRDLSRQYWRYGFWKFQMLRRYPDTIRWRQSLPPLLVISIIVFALLAIWFNWARWLLGFELVLYLLLSVIAGVQLAYGHSACYMVGGVPLSIIVMHFSWGAGFLWSVIQSLLFERNISK